MRTHGIGARAGAGSLETVGRRERERKRGERRRCHLSPLSLLPDVRLDVARSDQPERSLIQLLDWAR